MQYATDPEFVSALFPTIQDVLSSSFQGIVARGEDKQVYSCSGIRLLGQISGQSFPPLGLLMEERIDELVKLPSEVVSVQRDADLRHASERVQNRAENCGDGTECQTNTMEQSLDFY